jgi:hypothetical protein
MNYGIFEDDNIKQLFVIGDIHGDFYALKQALELTNCVKFKETNINDIVKRNGNSILLIDGCEYYYNLKDSYEWNKEMTNTYIVFSGDLIDRCRIKNGDFCTYVVNDENCDSLILSILTDLNNKAEKYNSKIIYVLGNHEIMNLMNKFKYVSMKGYYDKNRIKNIRDIFKENENYLYGIVRINNYIICHGGISPSFIEQFDFNSEFVTFYNKKIRNLLLSNPDHSIITSSLSPFWDRSNGFDNIFLNDTELNSIFTHNILKVPNKYINDLHLIVGHCPQTYNNNMGINLKNRIFRIDVSMSRAFDTYITTNTNNNIKELIQKIKNNNNVNILDFFNKRNENTFVQILKIKNNNDFEIIKGKSSLDYFFNDVFKDNYKYKYLYILHDLIELCSNKLNSDYCNEINDISFFSQVRTQIFKELYPNNNEIYEVRIKYSL